MKNETARLEIKSLDYYLQNHTNDYSEESHMAMMMAVEVLEQEPCKDCISRKSVLDLIVANHVELNGVNVVMYSPLYIDIKQLPPVTPQPKTGNWILADEQNKEDVQNDNYRFICSECLSSDVHAKGTIVPYCWKCGCHMVEPQESEG